MQRSHFAPVFFALALAPIAACSSSGIKAQRYDDLAQSRDRDFGVYPQEEVMSVCALDQSRSYFEYASRDLSDEDRAVIQEIGRCMTTGPLRGASIVVTGFADRTGPERDNYALGLSRARAVAAALASTGIAEDRIYVRSRGEALARGLSTDARALDRKVELRKLPMP